MRILIAADSYYPNVDGSSYFSQRLASRLKTRGHEVLVVAPSRSVRTGHFNHAGVNVFGVRSFANPFHKDYRFSPPLFIKQEIKLAIKIFAPDVVHIQGHFFVERTAMVAANKMGLPVIGTNHFMPENLVLYLHLPRTAEEWVKRLMWWQFREVFKRVDIVTTPTVSAKNLLRQIGLAKEVIPLSNGIDLERFHPRPARPDLKKKYRLPDQPLLFSVGRLSPEKNIDLILRALALVDDKIKPHLVIAGSGKKTVRQGLERLALNLGLTDSVTFTGFVPDEELPYFYNLVDCFITAGTAELQSLVTMEAMASGLPVLAARALALPELVRHGVNGYLFEPGNAKDLAAGMEKMFSDLVLRKNMAAKSLEIIKAHDVNKIVDKFEALYRSVVKK